MARKIFVTGDEESANAIETHFTSEMKRFCDKGTTELERVNDTLDDLSTDDSNNPLPQPAQSAGFPPASALYAQVTCTLQLKHITGPCTGSKGDYSLEPLLFDNNKAHIGYTQATSASAAQPLKLQSKLEELLIITPENHNDYVQIRFGKQAWPSNKKDNVPSCTGKGWTYNGGQQISATCEINCTFVCFWGMGNLLMGPEQVSESELDSDTLFNVTGGL